MRTDVCSFHADSATGVADTSLGTGRGAASEGLRLHYAPLPHARSFSFGKGNLWRIAVDYPGSPVPPCIHRAPATLLGCCGSVDRFEA